MEKFVNVRFDVNCEWEGFPPQYRIYVNDELFTERTFKWRINDYYIEELLQIYAAPGIYEFRLEEIEPLSGEFTISNPYIEEGEAVIIDETKFEILE